MKKRVLLTVTIILNLNCNAQVDSMYFGKTPPGDIPVKFAPEIITGFKHSAIAISPNGNEIFWTETEMMTPQEPRERIKYSEYKNGNWSKPIVANFIKDYLSYHNGSTVFSPDGKKLFFNSDRPGGVGSNDVYFVEKNENGWDSTINVGEPYNTSDYDISPVFTDSGKAYRIGYTNSPASFLYSNGIFSNLESIVNNPVSEWYSSTYISPDEEYVIFAGDDTPNLYIRFKNANNKWGKPINMGDKINTGEDERFPLVTPDGKYLFFIRGEGTINNYYWVSTSIIDVLKKEANKYFGQTPPGDTAIVFAPGIVSLSNRLEDKITFSPDGKECFFATGDGLYNMEFINNKWTSPKIATLKLNPEDQKQAFSKDGNRLYFTRFDPNYTTCDIGYFERTIDGWSDPVFPPSPFNTSSWEFDFTESNDGLMYIASNRSGNEDIWLIKTLENNSLQAVSLGSTVNSGRDDFSPCIAHDGSYLIFASTRNGDQDLYICFNKGNNEWTIPINMNSGGAKINFPGYWEKDPSLSPDGKYLFFNHHTSSTLRDIVDIYWVSTHINVGLKKYAFAPRLSKQIPDMDITTDSVISYVIPENTFFCEYGTDKLKYAATLKNGSTLPAWLHFDPETRSLSGIPKQVEIDSISVIATLGDTVSASCTFSINITSKVGISQLDKKKVTIYPNPTSGFVNLSFENSVKKAKVEIYNLQGTLLFSKSYGKIPSVTINLSGYSVGIYMVKVITDGICYKEKVIKE
jgi:Tol biopolymer transport system component